MKLFDMGFIICFQTKKKVKVFSIGDAVNSLIMSSAICKATAEKIAVNKKIETEKALKLVVDSILDSYSILN